MRAAFFLLLPTLLFISLSSRPLMSSSTLQPLSDKAAEWVQQTLAEMSLEEKVGQLLVAGTRTEFTNIGSQKFKKIRENIQRYHVGGYHAQPGNILTASLLLQRMQESARIPLLITADLEGGAGLIFKGATRFPKAMAVGATGEPAHAYQVAKITALEARRLGVHVNFYPIADVNNNPLNPIISIRSFGEDPEKVSKMAAAYIRGSQEHEVLATAKHFPGHGDTEADSHLELPVITAPLERLRRVELPPFQAAIKAGVAAIMTAHLYVPALEPQEGVPATLSRRILTGLLREEMGFEGLIFTDAINMEGISAHYSTAEAVVRAFQAGVDSIIFPPSVPAAFEALLGAVRDGTISEKRLEESVGRILEAKARLQLHASPQAIDRSQHDRYIGSQEHLEAAQKIMDAAITLVRDQKNVMPFRPRSKKSVLLLTVMDGRYVGDKRGRALVSEFRRRHRRTVHFEISPDVPSVQRRLLRELAQRFDYLVVGAYIRISAYKGSTELSPDQIELLRDLSTVNRPAAFVVFGSPYLLSSLPELPTYILTYEDYPGAELTAAKAILGQIPFRGKLPISLPELYPIGHGIVR